MVSARTEPTVHPKRATRSRRSALARANDGAETMTAVETGQAGSTESSSQKDNFEQQKQGDST